MGKPNTSEFGKLRTFFWPIHTYELKKIVPMFFMFFFISMCYSLIRGTKDALILSSSGAETLPFIKLGGVLPMAIVFMLLYSKASNIFSKDNLFYISIAPFVLFFAWFAWLMFYTPDALYTESMTALLLRILPENFSIVTKLFANWTYSLFYIMAELWGSVVLSLLFWQYANDITRVTEAKRFYSLFGLGANIGLLVAGPIQILLRNRITVSKDNPIFQQQSFENIGIIALIVVASSFIIILIHKWMKTNVLSDPLYYDAIVESPSAKKSKPKLSMMESVKLLANSKHLMYIALIVLSYNISINLIEVSWKSQIKAQFNDIAEISSFYGKVGITTAISTIFMLLFVSSNFLRRFGWLFTALVTPVVLLLSGAAFFYFIIFGKSLESLLSAYQLTPLYVAVIIGAFQNVMSKASKYSLFDPTKEMAYIPLDPELKVKGKAAIDVVGARLGKAMGSAIQLKLIAIGTLTSVAPHLSIIIGLVMLVWIYATSKLGQSMKTFEQK